MGQESRSEKSREQQSSSEPRERSRAENGTAEQRGKAQSGAEITARRRSVAPNRADPNIGGGTRDSGASQGAAGHTNPASSDLPLTVQIEERVQCQMTKCCLSGNKQINYEQVGTDKTSNRTRGGARRQRVLARDGDQPTLRPPVRHRRRTGRLRCRGGIISI